MNKKLRDKFFKAAFGVKEESFEETDLHTTKGREYFSNECLNRLEASKETLEKSEGDLIALDKLVKEGLEQLQYRINNVVEKVKGSILAERKSSGAVYTTTIPINNEQKSEETTTTIREGIAYGIPLDSVVDPSTLTLLKGKNLEFDSLIESSINRDSNQSLENFTISPKVQHSLPIEFKINLTGLIRTSASLVLDLKTHGILEIYKDGKLYKEKSLLKTIEIPVDTTTVSVGFRSYPSIHRASTIHFKAIGYTEMIYNEATTYVSKNISIGKEFTQIVIDTCDNSDNNNINIDYEISINDEPYEALAPVAKHQAIAKQSIVVLDKTQILDMAMTEGSKNSEGDYRFYIPNNLQNVLAYKQNIYLKNDKNIDKSLLYLSIQSDIDLNRLAITSSDTNKLFINGKEIKEEVFRLYKGVTTIVVTDQEGVIQKMNLDYINNLIGSSNVYISKLVKPILKDELDLKYVSLTNIDLINTSKKEVYFQGVKPKKYIDTIKIRATLNSLDKRTVPFISRILVRGA